jgi:hypothetical protein
MSSPSYQLLELKDGAVFFVAVTAISALYMRDFWITNLWSHARANLPWTSKGVALHAGILFGSAWLFDRHGYRTNWIRGAGRKA